MVTEPRTIEEITSALREQLQAETDALTNFSDGSFNQSYLQAHAAQIREAEIKALAAELAGVVEYAGRDLTVGDLDDLGVDTVTPAEVNEYMQREHLDLLARNFGQQRGTGSKATTRLEFTVADDTVEIEEGTVVSNSLQASADQVDFIVDVDGDGVISTDPAPTASPDAGSNTVVVDAVAASVGTEYNVGINTLTKIPVPQPGIQSVRNIEAGRGGEDAQSNESLRADIRNAFYSSSDGGTERGIINYIVDNTDDNISSVGMNEFTQQDPPFVDVVVDGGNDEQLRQLIQEAKPPGIEYNLARPVAVRLGVTAALVVDAPVDTDAIAGLLDDQLAGYDVGESVYRSNILQRIFETNASIISGPTLNTTLTSVTREQHTYQSGTQDYELVYGPVGRVTDESYVVTEAVDSYTLDFTAVDTDSVTVSITDGGETTDLASSAYSLIDDTGDGTVGTLSLDGSAYAPPRAVVSVSYQHRSWSLDSVVDDTGTTYTVGTDVALVDTDGDGAPDSLRWLAGGTTPPDGTRVFVSYTPRRSFNTDLQGDDTTVFRPAEAGPRIDSYVE